MRDEEPGFTVNDIIQEVGQRLNLSGTPSVKRDAYSIREIADALNISTDKAKESIRELVIAGKAEMVYEQIDYGLGPTTVRAYKLKGAP